ncbi:uncharacterized protein LOC127265947 [Andrographis paniculata]|uniref:uncharacterized protein LOC127265947 n=1 Tax=Andrographis paniculata TaxID=175694 RepID=UPI0021E7AEF8|nr:uncharacterized protein LOC127265947 [Andrographis paniculata]
MPILVQIHIKFSDLKPAQNYHDVYKKKPSLFNLKSSLPFNNHSRPNPKAKIRCCRHDKFKIDSPRQRLGFLGVAGRGKVGILARNRRRSLVVKFNNSFNGGGGGGNGKINSETARVLGNLALAILLTYLSMTGQLGWLLDAIVSLWLFAVIVPIVGIGAFVWWAGRDIVQGSCPNCGNEFQVFKSTLNDDLQLCPFCSQPFSVEGNEFVRDPVKFSNQSSPFGQAFDEVSARTKKRKESSVSVVDVEAEIRDAD